MITAKFIEECSNRFLCLCEMDGEIIECYVSSSSKLEKYIKLKNKKVMLSENRGKNLRTSYTLQAAKVNGHWVLLNLNLINELYFEMLVHVRKIAADEIQREKFVEQYKTDFYIDKQKLLIEAKGILADTKEAVYPVVSCGRALRQLYAIYERLREGFSVEYGFVLMNSSIKHIQINPKEEEVRMMFKKCIGAGMMVKFYSVRWYAGKCHLQRADTGRIEMLY